MLFMIVGLLFLKGLPSLSWYFITTPENAAAGLGQGIANAIAGTIIISLFATLIAGPFGFGTAVYMKRYAPDNGVTRSFRFLLEVLSGTPSIVVGIFGFLIFVVYLKQITGGFSLIAGAIALAILIMPVIERGIEEAIDRVPAELEEASYALGANKWQTIRGVTIPASFGAILTGFTLGFGRAAEESAIVLLTAGFTMYMPEFGIHYVNGASGGLKIFPLQDSIGTLPITLYNDIRNASLVQPSAGYAAAFVLVVVVFSVNIAGKAFLSYGFNANRSNGPSVFASLKKKLFPTPSTSTVPIGTDGIVNAASGNESSTFANAVTWAPRSVTEVTNRPQEPDDPVPADPMSDTSQPVDASRTSKEKTSSKVSQETDLSSASPPIKELPSPVKTKYRLKVRTWLQKIRGTLSTPAPSPRQEPPAPQKEKPKRKLNLRDFIRPFLLTLIPFVLVAALLIALAAVIPALSPPGTGGVFDFLKSIVIAIVICAICAIIALFLIRRSAQIIRLKKKNPLLGSRTGAFAAILLGICVILVGAFILSAHLFVPPVTTVSAAQEAGTPSAGVINTPIFSFNLQPQDLITLQKMNNPVFSFDLQDGNLQVRIVNQTITEMNLSLPATGSTENSPATGAGTTADRDARLAAFLAQQNAGEENSVSTAATATSSPAVTLTPAPVAAAPAQAPTVPHKNALDLGESYWYGDNYRPSFATVYNTSVLPFYFWWDIDWNRFVQQTPVQSGDVFLVIFIRIEDTGNMSAIVPSADSFVVVNKGQTYTHNIYFDTSVLSQSEIDYYTANYNLLPYQWIREIGQQKRDYAFLTGYNVFGQNQTLATNYTGVNSALIPPSPPDTNGQGYFIKPGRSNAIDGYLIYEVPASVAADLKDTYVQAGFNSFSPVQWRLAK
jgi:phosphate transport system permease protein